MDFSLKEGLGTCVAILCVAIVLYSLYNVGFFRKISNFINSSNNSDIVEVKAPEQSPNDPDDDLDN